MHSHRNSVQRTLEFPLIQEPQPLLGKGEREDIGTPDWLNGSHLDTLSDLINHLDALCELDHGWSLKEAADKQLHLQGFTHPPHDLDGQQGVAPKLEEVVMDTNSFKSENFGPD